METSLPPPIETPEPTPRRPTVITVICVLGFIGAAFTLPMIFTATARSIGVWYPPFLALSGVIGLICMIGLWRMRKWAVFTYTGFFAFNQVLMLAMGVWNIFGLVIPAIFIAVMFSQISKMK